MLVLQLQGMMKHFVSVAMQNSRSNRDRIYGKDNNIVININLTRMFVKKKKQLSENRLKILKIILSAINRLARGIYCTNKIQKKPLRMNHFLLLGKRF